MKRSMKLRANISTGSLIFYLCYRASLTVKPESAMYSGEKEEPPNNFLLFIIPILMIIFLSYGRHSGLYLNHLACE